MQRSRAMVGVDSPTRRQVLRAVTGLAATGGAVLLAACGGTASGQLTVTSMAASASPSATVTSKGTTSGPAATSAVSSTGAAAGAANSNSAGAAKATLDLWTTWGDKDARAEQAMADAFTKEQPAVTVKVSTVTDNTKFTAAIAAGTPPDLIQTWNAALVATWANSGSVVLLDPYIARSKLDLKGLDAAGLAATQLFGKQYAMPMLVYTNSLLYWNKSLFQSAGLNTDTPPPTWEELNDDALKFNKQQGGQISRLGYVPGGFQGSIGHVMWSFGGQLYSDDGTQATPDSPGVIKAVEFERDQITRFGGQPAISAFTKTFGKNATDPFYNSIVTMEINGEWVPTFIAEYKPDLSYGIGYMPYAASVPQAKHSGDIGTNPIVIPTGGKRTDQAWALIAFANTPVPNLALAKALGNTPQVLAAADMLAKEATTPELKFVLQAHKEGKMRATPINPISNDYSAALNKAIGDILSGKAQAPAALAQVKQIIQPKLDAVVKQHGG